MANGTDKYRSRRNRARVSELFWREWDPIGVNDFGPADEYDRYAAKAYVMLMDEGRSASEIADYLYYIASEHMGLGPSQQGKEHAQLIAERLASFARASRPNRTSHFEFKHRFTRIFCNYTFR